MKPYVPNEIDRRVVAHLRRLIGNGSEHRFRSRYALGNAARVDHSTLSKIFSGERGVGIDVFVALRDGLKVSADWLLDPLPAAEIESAIRPPEAEERALDKEVAVHERHAAAGRKRGKAGS